MSSSFPQSLDAAALEKAFAILPTRWLVINSITVEELAELLKQPAIAALDAGASRIRYFNGLGNSPTTGTVASIDVGSVMAVVKVDLDGGQQVTASITKDGLSG